MSGRNPELLSPAYGKKRFLFWTVLSSTTASMLLTAGAVITDSFVWYALLALLSALIWMLLKNEGAPSALGLSAQFVALVGFGGFTLFALITQVRMGGFFHEMLGLFGIAAFFYLAFQHNRKLVTLFNRQC